MVVFLREKARTVFVIVGFYNPYVLVVPFRN